MKRFFGSMHIWLFGMLMGIPAAWGAWVFGSGLVNHVSDSVRMRDWVLAKAAVQVPAYPQSPIREYRYNLGGRDYVGSQLGVGGEKGLTIGEWHEEIVAFLDDARVAGRSVSVYVNPDNPAQSVVDREVRATYLMGMSLLTMICAGLALGGAAMVFYAWFIRDRSPNAKAWRETGFLWFIGSIWMGFSVGMSIAVLPDALADGEYGALLVLIFPLVGLLIVAGAVASTWNLIWRGLGTQRGRGRAKGSGNVSLSLDRKPARMGEVLEGTITFPRSIAKGDVMRLRLACERREAGGWNAAWSKEASATARGGPDGALTRVHFEVPAQLAGVQQGTPVRWRLVASQALGSHEFAIDIDMQPAKPGAARASNLDEIFGAKR